jgi:hypothetical protein
VNGRCNVVIGRTDEQKSRSELSELSENLGARSAHVAWAWIRARVGSLKSPVCIGSVNENYSTLLRCIFSLSLALSHEGSKKTQAKVEEIRNFHLISGIAGS